MKSTRRSFLRQTGSLGLMTGAANLAAWSALAEDRAAADYKALVCIFLFGGNDANNMVIPNDAGSYKSYSDVRTSASGIMIPQANLLPMTPPRMSGARFGLHPSLSGLHQVWLQGRLAVLCNVGTLLEPLTRAAYQNRTGSLPENLFSHSDQQSQWQSAVSAGQSRTGWGGRVSDSVLVFNGGEPFPMILSLSGSVLYAASEKAASLTIPSSGTFGLNGFSNTAASQARLAALRQLLAVHSGNELVYSANDVAARSIASADWITSVLRTNPSTLQPLFSGRSDSLNQQLYAVARLIAARDQIRLKRQVFFCSLGGFDTHTGQLSSQSTLFTQMSAALKAFYDATVVLGIAEQVTAFTLSDFGRTFRPSAGQGSDHGWGSHHFILGGAVRGGDFYGQFPTLALDGPDDAGTQGRWIPSTSVDQYAATLAAWFGLSAADLTRVFPRLGRFPSTNLGFLG